MASGSPSLPAHDYGVLRRNPYVVALGVAALCIALLGAALASAWRTGEDGGGSIASAPAVVDAPAGAEPGSEPAPAAPPAAPEPTAASSPPTAAPSPTATPPSPTATPLPEPTATPTPVPAPTPAPAWEAKRDDLAPLAINGWTMSGRMLAKPAGPGGWWTVSPALSPGGPFAVEAEIAVEPPPANPCDSSYGIVVNANAVVWGAGLAFPCDRDGAPVGRVSDIGNPDDGYAQDRVIRQKPARIDPAGWHTLRIEVRGNDLRLFVDGEILVKAEDEWLADDDQSPPLQVGLWSDGLDTQVRRVAIFPLDPDARLTP